MSKLSKVDRNSSLTISVSARPQSVCKYSADKSTVLVGTSGWTEWDIWSPCEKTCGTGTVSRRRTCNDDKRSDVPKEAKSCKGVQREDKKCDNGKCGSLDDYSTKGKDTTGLSAPTYR